MFKLVDEELDLMLVVGGCNSSNTNVWKNGMGSRLDAVRRLAVPSWPKSSEKIGQRKVNGQLSEISRLVRFRPSNRVRAELKPLTLPGPFWVWSLKTTKRRRFVFFSIFPKSTFSLSIANAKNKSEIPNSIIPFRNSQNQIAKPKVKIDFESSTLFSVLST